MKTANLLFIILCWLHLPDKSRAQQLIENSCLQHHEQYEAGSQIVIASNLNLTSKDNLCVSSSYSSTLLVPEKNSSNSPVFIIPNYISVKAGIVNLIHTSNGHKCTGQLEILSLTSASFIESYVGPPSIVAGSRDKTMISVIAKDRFDNPLADDTPITISKYYNSTINTDTLRLKNKVGHKTFFSPVRTGKLFVSAHHNTTSSKEFEVVIQPNGPKEFKIDFEQVHNYADGNQVLSLFTDEIQDQFGNTVADGTLVKFIIKKSDGHSLFTQALTINGVAVAKIRHPHLTDNWIIRAFVDGWSQSNSISVSFNSINYEFEVSYDAANRTLHVGPIVGFMNQLVPDGTICQIAIRSQSKATPTLINAASRTGKVNYFLSQDQFPKGMYNYEIKIGASLRKGQLQL